MFLHLDSNDAILCPRCARGKQTTKRESNLEFWQCNQCHKPLLKTGLVPRIKKFTVKLKQLIKEF